MTAEQLDRLHSKMVKTQSHLMDIEGRKKAMSDSYNEQIKGAKKRLHSLTRCIESGDWELLFNIFDDVEIEELQNGRVV